MDLIFGMLEKVLQQMGLSRTEVKIYLAILPIGIVPASTIAKRLGIPRSTAKSACEQLHDKGFLLSKNKHNTVFYYANQLDSLHLKLDKERKLIDKKESDLNSVMGELKNIFHQQAVMPKVTFFEGSDGIIRMLNDVLVDKNPLYGALIWPDDMDHDVVDYLNSVYVNERAKLKFPARMLFNDNKATQEYRKNDKKMNRVSLLVPEAEYPFDICFHIYGDKIAFYSYKTSDMVGVIIQDPYVRQMQFSLFKMAWSFAKNFPVNMQYKDFTI